MVLGLVLFEVVVKVLSELGGAQPLRQQGGSQPPVSQTGCQALRQRWGRADRWGERLLVGGWGWGVTREGAMAPRPARLAMAYLAVLLDALGALLPSDRLRLAIESALA